MEEEYDEYEECEECGIQDEIVEYHEDVGDLGMYLCDACYRNYRATHDSENNYIGNK